MSALRTVAALVLGAAAGGPVSAHVVAASSPVGSWSFEPWVLLLMLASALLYGAGLVRLWRRAGVGHGVQRHQAWAFLAGWLLVAVALVSPLDPLGEHLFSAHMVQHEVLMLGAAPLLVIARPLAAWSWGLAGPWRQAMAAWVRGTGWRATWSALTHPLSAWSLHAIALWAWHLPSWFEAALVSPWLHGLQHASFFGTALLFWWTTLAAHGQRAQGAALLSLFTTMIHTGALGALMSLSPMLWYPHYADSSAQLGVEALTDQQLGGLIMWVPAAAVYLGVALWGSWRWLLRGTAGQAVATGPMSTGS